QLAGNGSGTPGPYTYFWAPSGGLSDNQIANPIASPAATTTYTLYVADANGCASSDDVTVTVNPVPTADAGADKSIFVGGSTTLDGSASGGTGTYAFAWLPATGL